MVGTGVSPGIPPPDMQNNVSAIQRPCQLMNRAILFRLEQRLTVHCSWGICEQEAAQTAQAELQVKLQQSEEAAEASSARAAAAEEAVDEAAVKAESDVAAIRQALSTANMAKAEMDAKLAKAAVAMNAAEELKEAR